MLPVPSHSGYILYLSTSLYHSAHTVTVKVVSRMVLAQVDNFPMRGLFYSYKINPSIVLKTKLSY